MQLPTNQTPDARVIAIENGIITYIIAADERKAPSERSPLPVRATLHANLARSSNNALHPDAILHVWPQPSSEYIVEA
jgi:hypothetical protein